MGPGPQQGESASNSVVASGLNQIDVSRNFSLRRKRGILGLSLTADEVCVAWASSCAKVNSPRFSHSSILGAALLRQPIYLLLDQKRE